MTWRGIFPGFTLFSNFSVSILSSQSDNVWLFLCAWTIDFWDLECFVMLRENATYTIFKLPSPLIDDLLSTECVVYNEERCIGRSQESNLKVFTCVSDRWRFHWRIAEMFLWIYVSYQGAGLLQLHLRLCLRLKVISKYNRVSNSTSNKIENILKLHWTKFSS